MVKETIPTHKCAFDLQMELISTCSFNRDYAEALYWAQYFHISNSELPPLVLDFIQEG